MDFGFSEDQEMLRSSVRDYLRAEAPASYARAMMTDAVGSTEKVWRGISELGWLGLAVPETYGGSGLGLLDLAIVMEEAGAVVFPGPLMSTICLGTPALVAAGSEAQKKRYLPELAAGKLRVTLAVAEAAGIWSEAAVDTTAKREGSSILLSGEKLFVPDARSADLILVAAKLEGNVALIALPRDAAKITPLSTIDETRKLDVVTLENARIGDDAVLGGGALEAGALDRLIDIARVLVAAEMCGAADASLKLSVEYVQIRKQFDRAIATFQAIQHKLADMKVALENARSLVYYAAWALDSRAEDERLAAAMAKAYASDACTKIAGDAIQVHGGIGFTWEHDLHLYFKRIKSNELTYGDASANRERIAGMLKL